MPNPFSGFNPSSSRMHRGTRISGSRSVVATPELPALLNLQHWYDFTDEDTIFSDEAGTIPSGEGDAIRYCIDKGTQPDDLIIVDVDPTTPTYHLNQINGYNIGRGATVSAQFSAILSNPSGPVGASVMMVGRHTGAGNFSDFMRALDVPDGVIGIYSDNSPQQWNVQVSVGLPAGNISKPVVNDEWLWLFGSHDGVDLVTDAAGGMEETAALAYVDIDAGSSINLFIGTGVEIAEFQMWDVGLNAAEKAQAIARTVGKYGALPF